MLQITKQELLESHVHMGHTSRKWNPKAAPFIFAKQNGFHIIDINKSIKYLKEAIEEISKIAKEGKKILFVATKKQAKSIIKNECEKIKQPYLTKRWPGGILTNFATIRKSIKKITSIDKYIKSAQYKNLTKKERLMISRDNEKLKIILNGVRDMNRIPGAVFIVDIKREHIALMEARKMNLPVFAIVDTNANPDLVDYPIPGNDDSSKSISTILKYITQGIQKALEEKKVESESSIKKDNSKDKKENTEENIENATE